jgi:hypothetical protein
VEREERVGEGEGKRERGEGEGLRRERHRDSSVFLTAARENSECDVVR